MNNNLFFILYTLPLVISLMYFTILKAEDTNKIEKTFVKGKLKYYQVMRLSFIPVLNLIIVAMITYKQFKKEGNK